MEKKVDSEELSNAERLDWFIDNRIGQEKLFDWLRHDIEASDRDRIASLLRLAARKAANVPPDILYKLADCLDPAVPKRRGPKRGRQDTPKREMDKFAACHLFIILSESKEWARYTLNQEKKAFELITVLNSSGEATNWNLKKEPPWKYPEFEPIRKRVLYPNRADLKSYVCAEYGLEERTFDTLISEHRKKSNGDGAS